MSDYVKPWEVEQGDALVGFPGRSITGYRYKRGPEIGSEKERQLYIVQLDDGREIPYNADGRPHVIRAADRKK